MASRARPPLPDRDLDGAVEALYRGVLESWNRADAEGFAAAFAEDGEVVGFDGSQLVPAGASDLDPRLNAVQSLVAELRDGSWQAVLYQNTPAQFHGRPELVEQLTAELRQALDG